MRTKHNNVDGSKSGTPRKPQITPEEHELRKNLLWGTREEKLTAAYRLYVMGKMTEEGYNEVVAKWSKS